MVSLVLGAVVALAQEPAADDAAEPEEESAPEEVVVYGELAVERARQAVVEELEDLGYDHEVLDLGDRTVYRHDAAWQGEVVLYDDGFMVVRRQRLQAVGRQMPWAERNSPLAWAGCVLWPWACVRVSGQTVGTRKWRGREARTVAHLAPKVREWGDRIADLATDRKVEVLPDALEALWREGRPLLGEEVLQTYAERRAALFEYWASRTDTLWGRQVRQTVLAFCRAVVQPSAHPFTAEELARLNGDRDVRFELPVR